MTTISSLRTALGQPKSYFKQLNDIVWCDDVIVRSTYFAQARITRQGKAYLLSMPLCATALKRIERFLPLQRHLKCGLIPRMEIFRDEMQHDISGAGRCHCDILLEPLPDALPLADAIANIGDEQNAQQLRRSLDALQRTLSAADVSHNNLKEENILIDANGILYPIRWYYATDKAGGDKEAIESLRTKIASSESMLLCEPDYEPYTVASALDKYLYAGDMHEGLIAVESDRGWGYVDCNCEEVIAPKYLWANDFCEGRAEVDTEQGMGLIDRQGNYIIEPIYETVEFDAENGWSRVCQNGKWALFDYSGEQLSPWEENLGGGYDGLTIKHL
jgi:hypothetical protein